MRVDFLIYEQKGINPKREAMYYGGNTTSIVRHIREGFEKKFVDQDIYIYSLNRFVRVSPYDKSKAKIDEIYVLCDDSRPLKLNETFHIAIGHPIDYYIEIKKPEPFEKPEEWVEPPPHEKNPSTSDVQKKSVNKNESLNNLPDIIPTSFSKKENKQTSPSLTPTTKVGIGIGLAVLGVAALVAGTILAFCTAGSALLILGLSTKIFGDILMMAGGGLLVGGIALSGVSHCIQCM